MTNADRLARVRFGPERALIETLFDRYGLEDVVVRYLEANPTAPWYELVTTAQVRLTPLIAPRLTGLLAEVCDHLGFDEPVDLFVEPSADINAFALHSPAEDKPHLVSITSGLAERMTDAEIRFVLGHEVGHLRYQHYRSRLARAALVLAGGEDESRLPPLLERRLEIWDRLAELSADRAGHTAVGGDIEVIVSAFFKMASGLGPEHLRYDINALLAQLTDLEQMERRDLLARFSHPVTPVRVRALQLFGQAGGFDATDADLEAVEHEVTAVARLMDFEATDDAEKNTRDLLIAGGLLVTHAGGSTPSQNQSLVVLLSLLHLTADPEAAVASVKTAAQAHEMLERAAAWLADNAGEERYSAFLQLAHVAAMEGGLSAGEEQLMLHIARLLRIPDKKAKELLYDALTQYVQSRGAEATPAFSFQTGQKS